MPDNVASSVLVNKPTDEVVAADAYGTPPSEVDKKADFDFGGLLKQAVSLATDQVKGKKLDTSKVVSMSADVGTQLTKEKEVPVKGGTFVQGEKQARQKPPTAAERKLLNKAAGRNLEPGLLQLAAQNYRDILGQDTDSNEIASNGVLVANLFDGSNKVTAVSLASSISQLTNSSMLGEWKDDNSWLAISMTYLDQAIALGVPELIDAIIENQRNKRLAKERLINSVRSVVLRGDINTLDKIIGYVGGEGVLARVPDAPSLFISRYRMPNDNKSLQHHQGRLLTTLGNIDSQWMVTQRNDAPVADLGVFRQVSPDAKAVLWSTEAGFDEYADPILTAPNYYTTPVHFLARRDFPLVSLRG